MTTDVSSSATSVQKSVTVAVPIAHAFKIFTERLDLWWPRTHHIGKVEMATAAIEAREGGRWYERGVDGSECEWGRVLAWSPPTKVALSWQISPAWGFEPDPAKASRLEVTFHDLGDGKTRVDLLHEGLDRHGEGWQELRKAVAGDGGWSGILERYAAAATESAAR